jgi:hypothetical protein
MTLQPKDNNLNNYSSNLTITPIITAVTHFSAYLIGTAAVLHAFYNFESEISKINFRVFSQTLTVQTSFFCILIAITFYFQVSDLLL